MHRNGAKPARAGRGDPIFSRAQRKIVAEPVTQLVYVYSCGRLFPLRVVHIANWLPLFISRCHSPTHPLTSSFTLSLSLSQLSSRERAATATPDGTDI